MRCSSNRASLSVHSPGVSARWLVRAGVVSCVALLVLGVGQAEAVAPNGFDTPNPQTNAGFGTAVALGDTNDDLVPDLLVGVPLEDVGATSDQGRAYLFDGATGALLDTFDSPNPEELGRLGDDVTLGDTDDMAVSAPLHSSTNS